MKANALAIAFVVSLFAASLAAAQQMKIEVKPPEREPRPEIVAPGLRYEQSRPSDHEFYPNGPTVEHDPAFIEGLSTAYRTGDSRGRVGVAGWTSPNTPVGPSVIGYREVSGWFGLGFSIVWNGPPASARPAGSKLPSAPVR